MSYSISVVILAAGEGTRMKSEQAKVLHRVGNYPMLGHVLMSVHDISPEKTIVVMGRQSHQIQSYFGPWEAEHSLKITPAYQEKPRGTGCAVMSALAELPDHGHVFVVFGDTPLVQSDTLKGALETHLKSKADITVLGMQVPGPNQYGRIIKDINGHVEKIVEYRDATEEERRVTLCNSGVMIFTASALKWLLPQVTNENTKREYYLTDTVHIAQNAGYNVQSADVPEDEFLGVNSRQDLATAESLFQNRMRQYFMDQGVTLMDPDTTYFSYDTQIARDVTIHPQVFFGPGVSIGQGSEILGFCHFEGVRVGASVTVGPFARLRPGAEIHDKARIGNFVEIKKSYVGPGAKVNHLTYIGDTHIGAQSNIGAGTITCNYDGFQKHKTHIGEGVFIGSNSALVAPVNIGDQAIIGAGSVITKNVEAESLSLSRPQQINRKKGAEKFRKSKQ